MLRVYLWTHPGKSQYKVGEPSTWQGGRGGMLAGTVRAQRAKRQFEHEALGVKYREYATDSEMVKAYFEDEIDACIDSSHIDGRADIYSLGVALYEMLTGKRPNDGSTVMGMLAKAVKGAPLPDVRTMRPEVSASVAYVLSLMCAPKPENRPVTSRAAADLLVRAAVDGLILPQHPPAQPAEPGERKGGWLAQLFRRIADKLS